MSWWRTTPPPWELLRFSRVLEDLRRLYEGEPGGGGKGRLSVRDEKGPQIMRDSIYPCSRLEGGIPEPQPKQETERGDPVPEIPQYSTTPAICHMKLVFQMFPAKGVVKMVMADTRKVYVTQALLHPALVQRSLGDAGSRKCGCQRIAKDPKSPAFANIPEAGVWSYLSVANEKNWPSENGEPVKSCQCSSRKKLRPREAGGAESSRFFRRETTTSTARVTT